MNSSKLRDRLFDWLIDSEIATFEKLLRTLEKHVAVTIEIVVILRWSRPLFVSVSPLLFLLCK